VCRRLDIPAARMNRLEDLADDPHLRAVGHFRKVADPEMGGLVFPANPIKFDDWQPEVGMPPRFGEHTADILGRSEGGWPDASIPQGAPT
jgi:crotonobetainyl-CoA:carnitine CoA-transferase CaiB-like acyl-CoA transferase